MRPFTALIALLASAAPPATAVPPHAAGALTCHPQGVRVSTDVLRESGVRRVSATIRMPAVPVGQAPPAVALQLAEAGEARSVRLTGMHAGPSGPGIPWSRLMSFRLEEVDSQAMVLRHSEPAYVFLEPYMKLAVESGPNGAYSFKLWSVDHKGAETEQSGALSVEAMPQAKLVLYCLGTDFELTDLRIE